MPNNKPTITIEELGSMCVRSMWHYRPFLLYKIADIVNEYYDQESLTETQQRIATLWYVAIMLGYAKAVLEHGKFTKLLNITAHDMAPAMGVTVEEFVKVCSMLPESEVDRASYLLSKLGDLDKAPQTMVASVSALVYQQDIANESETLAWKAVLGSTTILA